MRWPDHTYLICATQRSGSTLLCELLKSTGVAGRPEEYFEAEFATGVPPHPRRFLEGLPPTGAGVRRNVSPPEAPWYSSLQGITSYREHLERTVRLGTTDNGVFGAKLMFNQLPEMTMLARTLPEHEHTTAIELLSELFERLPEVGDPEKPKLVFFFDEAHLLFTDLPKVIEDKVHQVVRLVRSKGVGIFFVTQSPLDVPDGILGQLGNRVQHAVRAFTPKDQKAVKAAAQTFRANPAVNVEQVILELGVGEGLVSFLDEKGTPGMVERALICPPRSQIGPITPEQRQQIIRNSLVAGVYEKVVDRESAYELLKARAAGNSSQPTSNQQPGAKTTPWYGDLLSMGSGSSGGRRGDSLVETMAKSAARTLGSTVGRQIVRGVLGSLLGGSTRR